MLSVRLGYSSSNHYIKWENVLRIPSELPEHALPLQSPEYDLSETLFDVLPHLLYLVVVLMVKYKNNTQTDVSLRQHVLSCARTNFPSVLRTRASKHSLGGSMRMPQGRLKKQYI